MEHLGYVQCVCSCLQWHIQPFSLCATECTSPFIAEIFNVSPRIDVPAGTPAFSLAVVNLSEHMSGLFANLTLGFIPYRPTMATVPAFVETGISVWTHTRRGNCGSSMSRPSYSDCRSYCMACIASIRAGREWTTNSRVTYSPRGDIPERGFQASSGL